MQSAARHLLIWPHMTRRSGSESWRHSSSSTTRTFFTLRSYAISDAPRVDGVFHAKWPADVHEEWMSSLLANRPDLAREKLERTRQLIDKAAPHALVIGYEHLIAGLTLPDPKDRHVLAAAIRGGASVVVTCT
jgi:hypothetical protein